MIGGGGGTKDAKQERITPSFVANSLWRGWDLSTVVQAWDFLLYFSQSQLLQDAGALPAHYEFPGDTRQEAQRGSDPNLCQQVQEKWWLSRIENILTITSEQ